MTNPANATLSTSPKRPRQQTFDGFASKPRAIYDRLFNRQRRRQIPVQDLSPKPQKIASLSSYMIDPRYLAAPAAATEVSPLRKHFIDKREGNRSSLTKTLESWVKSAKYGTLAAAGSVGAVALAGWTKATSLIPDKYYKTYYTAAGGAKNYLLTRTQKLATIAGTGTMALTAILTLSFLNMNASQLIPPTGLSSSSQEKPADNGTATETAGSNKTPVSSFMTTSPNPNSTKQPQAASSSTPPAPITPAVCNCVQPNPSTPTTTIPQVLPTLPQVTSPITGSDTSSSNNSNAGTMDLIQNTVQDLTGTVDTIL